MPAPGGARARRIIAVRSAESFGLRDPSDSHAWNPRVRWFRYTRISRRDATHSGSASPVSSFSRASLASARTDSAACALPRSPGAAAADSKSRSARSTGRVKIASASAQAMRASSARRLTASSHPRLCREPDPAAAFVPQPEIHRGLAEAPPVEFREVPGLRPGDPGQPAAEERSKHQLPGRIFREHQEPGSQGNVEQRPVRGRREDVLPGAGQAR